MARALAATLLLLSACAPPVTVRGADHVAGAVQAAAAESARGRPIVEGRGGETAFTATTRGTPERRLVSDAAIRPAAPAGEARLDARWVGHYAAGPAGRAALGLDLREGRSAAAAPTLVGTLTLWAVAPASVFDGGVDARGPGRVVRAPLVTVHASGAQLRLVTEAFLDPTCGCTVHGIFVGTLRGDTISGRYELAGAPTLAVRRGRWTLVRDADAPRR